MTSARRDRRGGFSLVEVLVALAVTGLVIVAASSVTGLMRHAAASFDRDKAARDGLIAADKVLRELVTAAVPSLSDKSVGAASSDQVTLVTRGAAIMAFDRPLPVKLVIRKRTTGGEFLVVVWRDPGSDRDREEVLIGKARQLTFSYFGGGVGQVATWRAEWPGMSDLPKAVSLRVDDPALGAPIDLIVRSFSKHPQICIALPHEPACNRGAPQTAELQR